MQKLLWGNFIMQNAETLPAEGKPLFSTCTDLKIFGSSREYRQFTTWQESVSHLQWLKDTRITMMTRKGKIKLFTCSQWFSLLLVKYFPRLHYWVTAILNVKIQLPCQWCQQQYGIKTRKQQTRNIFLTTQTFPKSPNLPSQILVVRHLPRLKELWSCSSVSGYPNIDHIALSHLSYLVFCPLFSSTHITIWWATLDLTKTKPYKVSFWLNWLLNQPTPHLYQG